MSIGSTIKKIRREREMTQEQLAEYLGITANAVSQWECDRTAPDISQLPMLARVLRVTTDQLLGVDFDKDEAEIERILDESFDFYRAGQIQKAVEIARDGLKVYPNSFRLMARLAENLVGVKGCEEEMEGLCDKILKECTESRPREHAYRLKIVLCGQRGQYKEVKKLAENLPHVWASQEDLLIRFYREDSEKHRMELVEYAKHYLHGLTLCLKDIASFSCYSAEERIQILMQMIEMIQLLHPEDDFLSEAVVLAHAYLKTAELLVSLGKYDQALEAFEKMCEYAVYSDCHIGENISPAFRGYREETRHSDERLFCRDELLPIIVNHPSFHPLRSHPRYIKVMETLQNPRKG